MPASIVSIGSNADHDSLLAKGAVHVWYIDLALASIYAACALDLLDEHERARAARLRNDEDRAQFVIAHGMSRILLGRYLGCRPETVRFGYASHGKPHLLRDERQPDLRFNASRAIDLAMFAIAAEREVGIDAEKITHDPGLADAIARALSASERASLEARPSQSEKTHEFFTAWARKEAFLKATGAGLSIAPADVHTDAASGKISLRDSLQPGWRVQDIAVAEGYAAAIAAEGEHWHTNVYAFDGFKSFHTDSSRF